MLKHIMPRLVFESEEPITFHDDEGNVIAETTGGFILPLLASAAGPLISSLLESLTGKKADSMQTCNGSGMRLRKTRGKGLDQELMSYLVPYTNQGQVRGKGRVGRGRTGRRRGGDISMGAEEMDIPEGDLGGLEDMMAAAMKMQSTPIATPAQMGGVRRSPFSYNEITYPKNATGGRAKRRGRGAKKGGFAVDQQQSNDYSGFQMGARAMFPIRGGGRRT